MASLDRRFGGQGLQIIGLHSPEFEHEKNPDNVRREVRKLGVTYPVVLDNNLKMWDALDNHSWPATYLIDREGTIRHVHRGETHEGSREAIEFERILTALLKEARSSEGHRPRGAATERER